MPSVDPRDRTPQGDPDTVVLLPTGALIGLYIIKGVQGQIVLGIREDTEGHPVSCAVTNELYIDTWRSPQSNPRRHADEGET